MPRAIARDRRVRGTAARRVGAGGEPTPPVPAPATDPRSDGVRDASVYTYLSRLVLRERRVKRETTVFSKAYLCDLSSRSARWRGARGPRARARPGKLTRGRGARAESETLDRRTHRIRKSQNLDEKNEKHGPKNAEPRARTKPTGHRVSRHILSPRSNNNAHVHAPRALGHANNTLHLFEIVERARSRHSSDIKTMPRGHAAHQCDLTLP